MDNEKIYALLLEMNDKIDYQTHMIRDMRDGLSDMFDVWDEKFDRISQTLEEMSDDGLRVLADEIQDMKESIDVYRDRLDGDKPSAEDEEKRHEEFRKSVNENFYQAEQNSNGGVQYASSDGKSFVGHGVFEVKGVSASLLMLEPSYKRARFVYDRPGSHVGFDLSMDSIEYTDKNGVKSVGMAAMQAAKQESVSGVGRVSLIFDSRQTYDVLYADKTREINTHYHLSGDKMVDFFDSIKDKNSKVMQSTLSDLSNENTVKEDLAPIL